jgi:hypothetical protein
MKFSIIALVTLATMSAASEQIYCPRCSGTGEQHAGGAKLVHVVPSVLRAGT